MDVNKVVTFTSVVHFRPLCPGKIEYCRRRGRWMNLSVAADSWIWGAADRYNMDVGHLVSWPRFT